MDRSSRIAFSALAIAVAGALAAFGRPATSKAAVIVPHDDAEVLATLPFAPGDARRRETDELRRALAREPRDVATATKLARLDILLARERADPRYLGHAQAALAPWWDSPDAPGEVLVLRATIEQSLHDFDAALADLDRALAKTPGDVQAWLTKATVLTVRAQHEEARAACTRVAELGAFFPALVCTATVESLTGDARGALQRLAPALGRVSRDERQWGLSVAGEIAFRAGDAKAAEASFREALALDPHDAYTRGALADLLLDADRAAEAAALVAGQESNDALLLRLAIAEKRTSAHAAGDHVATLRARFDASRARGDVVHRREEARFLLELEGDAERALALAKANFDVQKEPWDVRILLETAKAARRPEEARAALDHVRRTKLEDPAIAALVGGAR